MPITKELYVYQIYYFFRYEGVAKEYAPAPYHPGPAPYHPAPPPYKTAQHAPYARQ